YRIATSRGMHQLTWEVKGFRGLPSRRITGRMGTLIGGFLGLLLYYMIILSTLTGYSCECTLRILFTSCSSTLLPPVYVLHFPNHTTPLPYPIPIEQEHKRNQDTNRLNHPQQKIRPLQPQPLIYRRPSKRQNSPH